MIYLMMALSVLVLFAHMSVAFMNISGWPDGLGNQSRYRMADDPQSYNSQQCTYSTCDKILDRESLCENHYLEMVVNVNANDIKGLAIFCRRGRLNMQPIMKRYGMLSNTPIDYS